MTPNSIGAGVRISGDEVRRIRSKGHVSAVLRNRRVVAPVVPLVPERGDRHPLDDAGGVVVEEHVLRKVRVALYEVGRKGLEAHISAMRSDGWLKALVVRLAAWRGIRDSFRHSGGSVMKEDVPVE